MSYGITLIHDYETTGTDMGNDRPVQIGVCDGDGRVLINTLCNPCMPISEGASKVHGITADSTVGFPDYVAAVFVQLRLFSGYSDPIIAGFNTSMFDNPMLEACLGYEALKDFRKLDLLDVIYRYYPALEKKKLTQLHEYFLGKELTGAHGAIQDCIGTAQVLKYVEKDLGKSAGQLSEELETAKAYDIMPIGKHRGRKVSEVPVSWARWMRNNATGLRPDLDLTIALILGE